MCYQRSSYRSTYVYAMQLETLNEFKAIGIVNDLHFITSAGSSKHITEISTLTIFGRNFKLICPGGVLYFTHSPNIAAINLGYSSPNSIRICITGFRIPANYNNLLLRSQLRCNKKDNTTGTTNNFLFIILYLHLLIVQLIVNILMLSIK